MKVAVPLVIEMTPEQVDELALEYDIATDAANVREFVRDHLLNVAQQIPAGESWTASLRRT